MKWQFWNDGGEEFFRGLFAQDSIDEPEHVVLPGHAFANLFSGKLTNKGSKLDAQGGWRWYKRLPNLPDFMLLAERQGLSEQDAEILKRGNTETFGLYKRVMYINYYGDGFTTGEHGQFFDLDQMVGSLVFRSCKIGVILGVLR